ncbi:MAG: hypothetical protein QF619_12050 [Candidatus Binatia bacterium]|nr:hypothetical protein [Candidatus Binatia bacterium]
MEPLARRMIDWLFIQWALDKKGLDLREAFQGLKDGLACGIEVRLH